MTVVSDPWSSLSKRVFCVALSAMVFALGAPAHAQQPKKVYRLGFLSPAYLRAVAPDGV